jgi:acetaldehyde dehydrogenase/alcohol dehydrogenase
VRSKELKELYLLAHRGCRIDAVMYNQDDSAAIQEAVNA